MPRRSPRAAASPPPPGAGRRRLVLALIFALGGSAAAWNWKPLTEKIHAYISPKETGSSLGNIQTFAVKRGDLRITMVEEGKLRAVNNYDIRMRSQGKITWLAEAGAKVKKGDKIATLDTTNYDTQLRSFQTTLETTTNQLALSERQLPIAKANGIAAVATAQTALETAELALKQYTTLDVRKKLTELDTGSTDARSKLADQQKKRSDLQAQLSEMLDEGAEKDKLTADVELAKQSEGSLKKAVTNADDQRTLYRSYTYPQDLKTKQRAVENAKLDLEKAQTNADNEYLSKEGEISRAKASIAQTKNYITQYQGYIDRATATAPAEGLVFYGSPDNDRYGISADQIKVGADWYYDGPIMTIPDLSAFQVAVPVAEVYRGHVTVGLPATVIIDAIPGLVLEGKLTTVSNVSRPKVQYDSTSPSVYDAVLALAVADPRMVAGMTVRVEILTGVLSDVLFAPVESVFNEEGKTAVFVWVEGDQPQQRPHRKTPRPYRPVQRSFRRTEKRPPRGGQTPSLPSHLLHHAARLHREQCRNHHGPARHNPNYPAAVPNHRQQRLPATALLPLHRNPAEVTPMPEPIVELRNLQKAYPLGEVRLPVLKGITLAIAPGDYVAIMGPSGSGKSTLLNLLGLLGDVPDDGDYFLAGENVSKLPDDDLAYHRNAHIGFIFQSFNLFPQLDVAGNIAVPMIYAGVPRREARERAEYLAGLVGLTHRLHHRSQQLSGGEMQRTAIARALSNQPPLLLADEPTGNLDEKTGDEIMASSSTASSPMARRCSWSRTIPPAQNPRQSRPEHARWSAALMNFLETLIIALRDLSLHKFRSALASLGIIFGVASVESMVSISEGARSEALERISVLGVDNIMIRSVKPTTAGQESSGNSGRTVLQFGLLRRDLEHIRVTCAPRFAVGSRNMRTNVYTAGGQQLDVNVIATEPEYLALTHSQMQRGRFLTPADQQQYGQVAVLGIQAARKIFGFDDPIDQLLRVDQDDYRIVGILYNAAAVKDAGGDDINNEIFIPLATAQAPSMA